VSRLEIVEPGPLALVEDLGRPGYAAIGVGASGVLDRRAAGLANRLVGNAAGAAVLELLFGGAVVRFTAAGWFAVAGAWGPLELNGVAVDPYLAIPVSAGAELRFGRPLRGARYYLAVRGGILAPALLGSLSSDTLSGLGPAPLAVGDGVSIGESPLAPIPDIDTAVIAPPSDGVVAVRLVPGPREDWFGRASVARLFNQIWIVSPASNRVGVRLEAPADGEPLTRARDGELPSEAMVPGAIQVPPSGLPTVLLADHPVTGGYPVIAVVADASLDAFAQLAPGRAVRFTRLPS
jgi:biotin-dependent carboxylase-like uncharacterized protein